MEAATGRRRTPIIAVSANAMEHQIRSYHDLGIDAVVPKPIELALLHEAIVAALSSDLERQNNGGQVDHCDESAA
jgi:CheY-like chemotaxis protein